MATVLSGAVVPALQEIGVLAAGATPTAEDAEDARLTLNRMVNQWAAEGLLIYSITRRTFTITSGTGAYSVAGTATVPRPVFIEQAGYIDTSTSPDTEYLLGDMLTDAQYAGIVQKALTGDLPSSWHYNPTYPSGTLEYFPVPTSTTLEGVIYAPQPVGSFPALTTSISLPPGYEEFIVTHLALRLATPYGKQVDPSLRERAVDAKAIVKRANRRLSELQFPADALIGGGGNWSIYTGP